MNNPVKTRQKLYSRMTCQHTLLGLRLLFEGCSELKDSFGLVNEIVEFNVEPEESDEEVVVHLVFVSVLGLEQWLQNLFNTFGSLDQMIMWDLVKEMVSNMSVSDVMHGLVQSESIETINGLSLSTNKAPLISLVNLSNFISVLKIGDNDEHASEEGKWNPVVPEPVGIRTGDSESNVGTCEAASGGNDALDTLRIADKERRVRPEVRSIAESEQGVHWEPFQPSGERHWIEKLLPGGHLLIVFVLNPHVSVILVNVVSESVMKLVTLLPWEVGREEWGECDVSNDVVENLVIREGSMKAIVSNNEQGESEHSHQHVPCQVSEKSKVLEDGESQVKKS